MIPNFQLFDKVISPYMVTALAGIFSVIFFTYKMSEKKGLDEIKTLTMMLFAFLGVFFGSHIFYGFTVPEALQHLVTFNYESFDDFLTRGYVAFGGSVFYGGLLGAILACFIYTRKMKLNTRDYFDIAAISIPLFHFFGRIGCFLGGCCYGVEWEHGFVYHYSPNPLANEVPRFPVQLVEAALNLILFFVLWYLYSKGIFKKRILNLYLIIYPIYRFLLEYLRGDTYRGFIFGLSTSQFVSIILIIASVVELILYNRKRKREPAEEDIAA